MKKDKQDVKPAIRLLRIIMPVVAIASLVIFPPWDIVWTWLRPLPGTVEQQVDAAMDHGLDGIVVYVDLTGEEPALYSAGWKNRESKVPADPHALFKIASISKLYVALATVKLANDGRLSLDDALADHLPDLVGRIENAEQITLRLMLQHRSGIPNYSDHPDFPWDNPPKEQSNLAGVCTGQTGGLRAGCSIQLFKYEFLVDRRDP